MTPFKSLVAATLLLAASAGAWAQATSPLPGVDGEVRKVDAQARKVTLRHADIPNIDMGAMTMVFSVKDAALLEKIKPGDPVRFTADRVDGVLTLISIEIAKP